jgi:predicted transposase/invertase (TIGR01784 family)
MYFDVLKKRVGDFKNSEEGRHVMCRAMERIEARGKARGERKGKRETMLATAKRLLANGKLMLKEIAECSGLSLAQVKRLQASMA